jgi:hypothetical protein
MINSNSTQQSGYYDMDQNMVIGDNSSEVDVLNTTPFSVRDILNIVDQNNEENNYQTMHPSEQFTTTKFYGGNNGAQFVNNSQYKR